MRAWVALALLVALASAPSFADPVAANAWGWNLSGQLGDGSPLEKRLEPCQIGGLDTAVAVDGGNAHSLALSSDHTLWAWGSNLRGQIGDGTNDERRSPVVVPDLTEVTAIAAGYQHSLALRSDGTLWSWGANQYGQLGDGANTNRNAPVQVVGLPLAKAVAAGGHFYSSHTLAVAQDGTVWAWGRNAYGQLGDGTTSDRFTPVQVTGLTDVVAVAAGSEFSLALRADHTVWAWGRNNYGQLGDGTTTNRSAPVQAWTVDDAEAIVAGDGHALALRTNHRMWAWGLNTSGQLGDTTTTNKTVPVVSTTITDALGIACGGWHNTVLRSDGTVWGWGGNSNGQLGDGTNADELTPTQIADLSQVASLTSRNERSFAVVMRRPTAIGVSPVETHRGLSVALVAQLGTDEAPLPGRTLHFSVDGTDVGTAVTEADGSAALSYAVPPSTPIGARLVLVQWAGELDYLASRGTGWLWVDGMLTSTYVPDRYGTVG
ncbi:MAG: RCC1 repeat-containing protein, partial [Armatimonadetes bacterium]|nr:RCC1 repeat-containing protein [Armatimonadota bacterium]